MVASDLSTDRLKLVFTSFHFQIMEIPSKLFYKNKLTCRAEFPSTGPQNIPPLKFIGVDGQEAQEEDSPSYYNDHEGLKITEQVKLLVTGGLRPDEVCVLAYYQKQVTRIRHLLRNERLGQVSRASARERDREREREGGGGGGEG